MDKEDVKGTETEESSPKKKKANWDIRPYLGAGLTALIVIVISILVFFVFFKTDEFTDAFTLVRTVFQPIVFGMAMAYIVNPILRKVEAKTLEKELPGCEDEKKVRKKARRNGVLAATFSLIGIIVVIILLVVPQIVNSVETLIEQMPSYIDSFNSWYDSLKKSDAQWAVYLNELISVVKEHVLTWFNDNVLGRMDEILQSVTSGVVTALRTVLNFIIGIAVSVYILASKDSLKAQTKKFIYTAFKPRHANWIVNTMRKSDIIFGGFIIGKIIDSIIIGAICFVFCLVTQMPYAALIGVIIGVTNIIPFFGPFIGAIPCTLLILLIDPWKALVFVIFIIILQQIDGNIIGPKILGDRMQLSMFWVLFAILVFGGLFGVVGVVLGCPIFGVIYYIVQEIQRAVLKKRGVRYAESAFKNLDHIDEETGEMVYHDADNYVRTPVDKNKE